MDTHILLVLAVLAFVAWVVVDLRRNKLTRCPRCKGTGELKAQFFPNRYRPCPRCKRTGEIGRR